ncbi:S26 family signal peptidase [Ruegeria sp. SCPT10]|uniref:S26 family signal peptidase n=1 Tax=Ruegeria sp. SCP10 TaxID=3141377 RepID=UPI00333878BE
MLRSKPLFCVLSALLVITGYYALAFVRIGVNASESLNSNGFVMVTWPKPIWHGAIVSARMPDVLAAKFDGKDLLFTKRVVGMPGDPVVTNGNSVCINSNCVTAQIKDGQAVSPVWTASSVPAGHVALFGETQDSLDSRYAVIGGIDISTIEAVGIAIPFPHWTQLQEWIE